jgi:hypothetical protein
MRKRKADHPGKKKGLIKKEGLSELRPSFFGQIPEVIE